MKCEQSHRVVLMGIMVFCLALCPGELWADANDVNVVEINVTTVAELEAAIVSANPGDTIILAEGTYNITSQLEIKSGVTYQGAGAGKTIIDGGGLHRAFVGWGDRDAGDQLDANGVDVTENTTGPKDWVLADLTIQNCVADSNDRYSFYGTALDLLGLNLDGDSFEARDTDGSGGLDIEEASADNGGIRLPGPDGIEQSIDDDIHRFEAMDTDGDGELTEAELNAQLTSPLEAEFNDQSMDGGAVFFGNSAMGTIQNCDFLNNHTPPDGDDGGAIRIGGFSTVTINDCNFIDNYACSPDGTSIEGADGDGGHLKVDTDTDAAIIPGTTLIVNRCNFVNGSAEDAGGAIQCAATGGVIRLDACWFERNTAAGNGSAITIGDNHINELTITNCYFFNNRGSLRMIQSKRNTTFVNCSFVDNVCDDKDLIRNYADAIDTDNDGLEDEFTDTTEVVNCLFADNKVGGGDYVLTTRQTSWRINATNCLFFGNTRQDGSEAPNIRNNRGNEMNSVLADPLLGNDLLPGPGSPAIDGGIDPILFGIELLSDISGNPRPLGAGYDIGADEQ